MTELDYELPEELIATSPTEKRDAARLFVCSRSDPNQIEHCRFSDLPEYLREPDILVMNNTRVLPARFRGIRIGTRGHVHGLFLSEIEPGIWHVLLRSNGHLRQGDRVSLSASTGPAQWELCLRERHEEGWHVELLRGAEPDNSPALHVLEACGEPPLPPYILAARKARGIDAELSLDREWYQTIYASRHHEGSVAAPTAGLHFSHALLERLTRAQIGRAELTLDVGYATFKPVTTEHLEEHEMHSESIEVPETALSLISRAKEAGGRCICVGTTTVRALESVPPQASSYSGVTRLLIQPGYQFGWTDALITNFHLPRSTLLALVAALFPNGVPSLLEIYREAIDRKYRFYSYGDAMLILP